MYFDLLPQTQKAAPARDRLLRAALTIFSREGLHGATTRGIADEAGVNEVTLFRLFGTKDGLLQALLSSMVVEAVSQSDADKEKWSTGDLRENLRRFAESHYNLLAGGEAFIRTMIGEARRYPEGARKILNDAGRPLRDLFVANLEAARETGKIRDGLDLGLAAEAFMDTIFSAMLRFTAGICGEGSPDVFLALHADIFAAGLAAPQAAA